MRGVRRELLAGLRRRSSGKLSSCMTVGTSAVPRATIASTRSVESPVPCSMQSMPASIRSGSTVSPKQWAVTLRAVLVRRGDRRGEGLGRERRRQVAGVAVDPVADELDPAVAALRPPGRRTPPARRARSRGRSCGCSAWSGRCAGRPGSAAAGRRGRGSSAVSAAEPQSRSSSAPASRSAIACSSVVVVVDGAVLVEPDVAVRVDQARARSSPRRPSRRRPGPRR